MCLAKQHVHPKSLAELYLNYFLWISCGSICFHIVVKKWKLTAEWMVIVHSMNHHIIKNWDVIWMFFYLFAFIYIYFWNKYSSCFLDTLNAFKKRKCKWDIRCTFLSLHDFCTKCLISNCTVFDTLVLHWSKCYC